MSATMAITLYAGLAVALAMLRGFQGQRRGEAFLAGLLWPFEMLCQGMEAAAILPLNGAADGVEADPRCAS